MSSSKTKENVSFMQNIIAIIIVQIRESII